MLSKNSRFKFLITFFFILLTLLTAEAILRFQGYDAYHPYPFVIQSIEPEPYLKLNDRYGFFYHQGQFTIRYNNGYHFVATHGNNATRITRPPSADSLFITQAKLHIYGCSFTYGQGLADSLTYPWRVQQQMRDYNVVNYGVGSYGILHALLQLEEHIEQGKQPDIAVVSYASFHDERSTFTRQFRKNLLSNSGKMKDIQFPVAHLKKGEEWAVNYTTYQYRAFPLNEQSALMNFLENGYNRQAAQKAKSHEVAKKIMEAIIALCQKNEIRLVIAGISQSELTSEMLTYCQKMGAETVNIGVDLSLKANNLRPYDNHPSGKANEQYTDKLMSVFQ